MADPVMPTPHEAALALEVESLRAKLAHTRRVLVAIVTLHERMLAFLTSLWGLWLLSPWWNAIGASPTFAGLRDSGAWVLGLFVGWLLPSLPVGQVSALAFGGAGVFWGGLVFALGLLQAAVSARGTLYHRQIVAVLSGGFWLYIALSFASTNFPATSTPVYTWLAASMWLKVYVLAVVRSVLA